MSQIGCGDRKAIGCKKTSVDMVKSVHLGKCIVPDNMFRLKKHNIFETFFRLEWYKVFWSQREVFANPLQATRQTFLN